MATDVHDYERMLAGVTRRLQESSLPVEVKEDVLRFRDECFAQGLSAGRVTRYLHDVKRLLEWHGRSLRGITLLEVKALVTQIERSSYAPASKRDLKIALRKLVQFQQGAAEPPPEVRWIRPSAGVRTMRIPEELLTPEDVTRLVTCAETIQERALLSTLYESGCRIGEILSLQVKHVRPADVGMILRVDGKTGPRRVRVISSAPYLTELLNLHPDRENGDAPLWLARGGKVLHYAAVAARLRRLAKRAGVNKKLHPHLFRHSRATHLANHLTEAQMKEYFGWIQSSEMAAVYVHLSGRDVDEAILRLHGLKPPASVVENHLVPLACGRCRASNPATHRFCMVCGTPLTEAAATAILTSEQDRKEADAVLDVLIQDPEVQALLKRKIAVLYRQQGREASR